MPKVSVIIPTHNRKDFVCQAVDSVLAQTYRDFEIIVIDDGSTDGTQEVLKKYGDQIRYFYQQNKGISVARNFAISQSKGEYLAFLDDDDLWLPERLAKQVPLLDREPSLGLVCSEMYAMDKQGNTIEHYRKGSKDEETFENLLDHSFIPTLTVLMRRSCFDAIGRFDEDLHSSQDYDLWLRLAKRYKFYYIPEPLAKWRLYEGNIHKQYSLKLHDYLRIYSKKELTGHWNFWQRKKCFAKVYVRIAELYYQEGKYFAAALHYINSVLNYPLVGKFFWPPEAKEMRFSLPYRIFKVYSMAFYCLALALTDSITRTKRNALRN